MDNNNIEKQNEMMAIESPEEEEWFPNSTEEILLQIEEQRLLRENDTVPESWQSLIAQQIALFRKYLKEKTIQEQNTTKPPTPSKLNLPLMMKK